MNYFSVVSSELILFSFFWNLSLAVAATELPRGRDSGRDRSGTVSLDIQRLPTTAPIQASATTPTQIHMAIACVAAPIATPTAIPTAIQIAVF